MIGIAVKKRFDDILDGVQGIPKPRMNIAWYKIAKDFLAIRNLAPNQEEFSKLLSSDLNNSLSLVNQAA